MSVTMANADCGVFLMNSSEFEHMDDDQSFDYRTIMTR